LKNLNRWALGWSVVWIVLVMLLIAQLVLLSIPDGDTILIGVDSAAIVFVLIRLRRSIAVLRHQDK
jgi:hypothetical protein